ncbi:hypothetical protein FRC07_009102, partial [Ceratobasidium sp. 392]
MVVAQVLLDANATTPQRRGRRAVNILVVRNPDHSSSEDDTPANSAAFSASSGYNTARSRPPTTRAPSPDWRPLSPPGRRALLPLPPQRTPSERIIVAVTHDTESYVVVDITKQTDAQAVRERILTKLHIPDDLHASFAIYRTELGGFTIGGALDDNQLLIDCQHFGDDRGSLKFLAQRADAPTDDLDIPIIPPSNAPVPPMLPSLSTFSPGASSASDRLVPKHFGSYEADFDIQTRPPIETLHHRAADRHGRQLSSSSRIVRRQVRRRDSGSAGHNANQLDNLAPPTVPILASIPQQQQAHARIGSETIDNAHERDLALAAEERRREERKHWQAKRDANLEQKRQQWAKQHSNRVPPGEAAPAATPMLATPILVQTDTREMRCLMECTRLSARAARTVGRQMKDGLVQQQPRTSVRQQGTETVYAHEPSPPQPQQLAQQSVRQFGRQPSPEGGYGQPRASQQQSAPQPQPSYPSQNQVSTNQYMQNTTSRIVPPGPPPGAMLPRIPGADYISQGQQARFAGIGMGGSEQPEGSYRGAGITGRPQSPQPQSGACSTGNLHDANNSQIPLPPIPTVQNLAKPIIEVPSSESPLSATEAPPIMGQASPMAPAVGLGVKRYKKLLAGESGEVSGPLWQIPKQNSTPAMSASSSSSTSLIPRTATHPTPKPPVVITRIMPESEVIAHLGDHGCDDITDQLDLTSSSAHPVFTGGFGDIYRANLLDGTQVAIKA